MPYGKMVFAFTETEASVTRQYGNAILAKRFQKKLRSCSSPPGEASQQNLVTPCVGHGSAGVVDGVVIPFQDLYKM